MFEEDITIKFKNSFAGAYNVAHDGNPDIPLMEEFLEEAKKYAEEIGFTIGQEIIDGIKEVGYMNALNYSMQDLKRHAKEGRSACAEISVNDINYLEKELGLEVEEKDRLLGESYLKNFSRLVGDIGLLLKGEYTDDYVFYHGHNDALFEKYIQLVTVSKTIGTRMPGFNIPEGMKGVPISFIVAGILALAFMGFTGMA